MGRGVTFPLGALLPPQMIFLWLGFVHFDCEKVVRNRDPEGT